MMNDIKREIMESIDILLKKRLEKITQSYYVNIISINNNKCTVKLNGAEYIVPFYGNTPQVNKKYPIIIPQGNFSQAYVIG
jgi:hypothetical protein